MRVLLVEHQSDDVILVSRALGGDVETTVVENEAAFRASLATGAFDAVVSDWSLPGFGVIEALAIVKTIGLDIPFLVVSGVVGEERAVEVMRAGAHDYVLKNQMARLRPALDREVRDAAARRGRAVAEDALRREQEIFRRLIEKNTEVVSLTGADGKLRFVSPAIEGILGYKPAELVGTFLHLLVHPDDHERLLAERRRVFEAGGKGFSMEARGIHKDGSTRWLELSATNLLDDPDVRAVVGNFRDITERKLSAEALRSSEARFRRLSEAGLVGISTADLNGVIYDSNKAFATMLGYTPEEMQSQNWAELTPPEFAKADRKAVDQLRRDGVSSLWEKEMFHKDGHRVPILLGVAMLDARTCIAIIADLSARRDAEAALRDSEEQFRQAQKMESIGRLAGGVAHDFNNLLSVILSYSSMLKSDLRPADPMREDLDEITKAGERAVGLTRQLLAFSRRQVLKPRVLDPNEIVVGMEKMLRRLISEDIELRTIATPNLGNVHVDPGQIEQVLMNLAVNARDAMPRGGRLHLETGERMVDEGAATRHGIRPGRYVTLAVADTGEGMDAKTIARIFEPFFTTKEQGKGTGLGLSTVFGIAKQSGGAIEVESEVGKGTVFTLLLPVSGLLPESAAPRSEPREVRGTETILLVEDEATVRTLASTILRRLGYRVLEAPSGGDAIVLCEQHKEVIHLLLTDVVMPLMDGREVAERVRAVRPEIRVLFMSGYTDDDVLRRGALFSDLAFLEKPILPEMLARKVREVLDARP